MELEIRNFELPPIGTLCHVVLNPVRQRVAVFDAPLNAFATVERLLVDTGYKLEGVYYTHGHWDHTLDGAKFNAFGTPSWAHPGDRRFFEEPASMARFAIPGMEMPPVKIEHWLEDGQGLEILGRPVEVRHVPGHSPGSVIFWFKEDGFAIAGDAVFQGSIGRTDLPNGSFEQLAEAIRTKIYSLPDETKLYPGHGPATSVGREALNNPFVTR